MDKLDWKILEILDTRARTPLNQIAKLVRSNKDVVSYRISRLEEQGIIKRYFPVFDMSRLGYHTIRLYFDLEEMDTAIEKELIAFLDKEINAGLIFRMDYPYRYGIFLWTKSIYGAEQALLKIKRKFGSHLISYNFSLLCENSIYPKDYLFAKKHHETKFHLLQQQEKRKYDEHDYLILRELAQNARASTVQIAQKLHLPQTTVSHKIKELEKKKIILAYRAELNITKLGYTNYFLEIYLDNNHNLAQIEAWANTKSNTVWLQKIIGRCDIEIELEVKDRAELEQILNELRTRFPNIRKIIFWSQDYKKLTFLP